MGAFRTAAGRRWLWGAVALAVGYSVLHLAYSMWHYSIFSNDPLYRARDIARVFEQATALRHTGALPALDVVLYPPLYYLLFLPLTFLDFRLLTYVLYLAQLIYFPAAIALLVKAASPAARPSAMAYLIASVLVVNFQPFLETLAMYKVEGVEFFLICLALYILRRQRKELAGGLICLAANLKFLPGILAVYFLLKREWRVLAGMLMGWGLVCAMIGLSPLGAGGVWAYGIEYPLKFLFGHTLIGTRPEASFEWQSLNAAVNRWFVGPEGMMREFISEGNQPIAHPQRALAIAAFFKMVIGGAYVFWLQRAAKASPREAVWERTLLEVSMTLLLIVIFASAARVHYAILLLPAYVITALVLYYHPALFRWKEWLLFALAYSLPAMVIPGGLLNRLPPTALFGSYYSKFYLWLSLPFYGYVLLAVCILRCHARLSHAHDTP